MGVPLLYPALALWHLLAKFLVTKLLTRPSTSNGAIARLLRGLGARPARSFSFRILLLSYVPPGIFYFNMYYNSAVGYCFRMLKCTESVGPDGAAFLITAPEIRCWEGDHAWLSALAVLLLCFYAGGVGLIYSRLLFVLLPAKGLDDPLLTKLFGFVYLRFKPQYYWYELVEIGGKLSLLVINAFVDSPVLASSYLVRRSNRHNRHNRLNR